MPEGIIGLRALGFSELADRHGLQVARGVHQELHAHLVASDLQTARLGMGWVCRVPPDRMLDVATRVCGELTTIARGRGLGPVRAAIDLGEAQLGDDGPWGSPVSRVDLLLGVWFGHEVPCTHRAWAHLDLPPGVGGHRARHDLEHLVGSRLYLLVDAR